MAFLDESVTASPEAFAGTHRVTRREEIAGYPF